jgi:hypothetical protein
VRPEVCSGRFSAWFADSDERAQRCGPGRQVSLWLSPAISDRIAALVQRCRQKRAKAPTTNTGDLLYESAGDASAGIAGA